MYYINELETGDAIDGFFLLQSATARQTAAGKPFLTVTLADRTVSIEGQVWDYSGPLGPSSAGSVVKVLGAVTEYRGARQITVERIRPAFKDDVFDPAELVPSAPIDHEASWQELNDLANSIVDDDYRAVTLDMIERYGSLVRSIPAAKSVHHAFLHGLLMHTLNMARTADFLSELYYDTVDRSLLLAGTILHDFAKCREFTLSPLGVVVDYSPAGHLLGHLTMGAEEVGRTAARLGMGEKKTMLLQHMILSHHGEPEHGAAIVPACAEAELLSYIDKIDSRMEIYRETFEETPVDTLSRRIFALEKRIYNHMEPETEPDAE